MDKLIYTVMSGAIGAMFRQDAVANNLANVSTNGYKSAEHRLRAAEVQPEALSRATSLPTRAFAVDAATHTDFSQGPLIATGRNLDVAVRGKGWIALSLPDGSEAYTRAGNLEVSENGVLQTASGIPVAGDGGPIAIPPDSKIAIGEDGTISVVPETGTQATVNAVGRIKLVNPPEVSLVRGPDGLFRMDDGSQAPTEPSVKIASGFAEGSNVNPVEQMVAMISLARQYEMQIRMLQSADANDRAATQVIAPR